MVDVSFSPVARVLPDRCTAELRRLHSELGARHSFRELTRLLETFLPCSPPNHTSVRNRLGRVAEAIEATEAAAPFVPVGSCRQSAREAELVVVIDGRTFVPPRVTRTAISYGIWLLRLTHLAAEAIYLNGDHLGPAVRRFLLYCRELREYLDNNSNALIDYGSRSRSGRPISGSGAEGSIEEIANRPHGQAPMNALVASRRARRRSGAPQCSMIDCRA